MTTEQKLDTAIKALQEISCKFVYCQDIEDMTDFKNELKDIAREALKVINE